MKFMVNKTVKEEFEQFPCIHCGFDGMLELWQDRKYDTATLSCSQCNKQIRGNISWDADYVACVEKIWNPYNNRQKRIHEAEDELAQIPIKQKKLQQKIEMLNNGFFLKDMV